MQQNRRGFTLVELAIVLVIVGLIVGGVFVGRDLIRAAQLRQQMRQFEEFETAHATFFGKYNCLPGDCAGATRFFSGLTNGNGDHQIRGGWPPTYDFSGFDGEMVQYWRQLSAAGLIALTPTGANPAVKGQDFPKNSVNSGGMVLAFSHPGTNPAGTYYGQPGWGQFKPGHYLWLNIYSNTLPVASGGANRINNHSGRLWLSRHAAQMDTKLDDGNGLSGRLIAPHSWMGTQAMGAELTGGSWSYNTFCRDGTTGAYHYQNFEGGESLGDAQVNHAYPCYLVYRLTD